MYEDIYRLGTDAFLPGFLPDIESVLTETFNRTAFNLKIIYQELKARKYCFKSAPKYNFDRPLHSPLPDTDVLLDKLVDITAMYLFHLKSSIPLLEASISHGIMKPASQYLG